MLLGGANADKAMAGPVYTGIRLVPDSMTCQMCKRGVPSANTTLERHITDPISRENKRMVFSDSHHVRETSVVVALGISHWGS